MCDLLICQERIDFPDPLNLLLCDLYVPSGPPDGSSHVIQLVEHCLVVLRPVSHFVAQLHSGQYSDVLPQPVIEAEGASSPGLSLSWVRIGPLIIVLSRQKLLHLWLLYLLLTLTVILLLLVYLRLLFILLRLIINFLCLLRLLLWVSVLIRLLLVELGPTDRARF